MVNGKAKDNFGLPSAGSLLDWGEIMKKENR